MHVVAPCACCQSRALIELVGSDILIAEIDFIPRYIRCSSHYGKQQYRRNECNGLLQSVVSRKDAERRLVDELLGLFGGRAKLVMAHLVESGELTLEDVKEAEKALRKSGGKDKPQ